MGMLRSLLWLIAAALAACGHAMPVAVVAEEMGVEVVAEEPEEPPPDPVERGTCTLTIRLHESGTRNSVEASVQLWRLDAPENDDWTRGDQLQASCEVSFRGETLFDLPAGRYRLFSADARRGATDPEEFTLEEGHSDIYLPFEMPRRFDARLLILDESGRQVTKAAKVWGGRGGRSWTVTPEWRVYRQLRSGFVPLGGGMGHGCGGGRSRSEPVVAGHDGFDVGTYQEATRASSESSSHTFKVAGATDVRVYMKTDAPTPWNFVARSVPRSPLWNSIFVEGRPLPADARFDAWSEAGTEPGPIKVNVQLAGYEKLEFEWRPGDPLPFRELTRESAPASPAPDPSRS